MRHDLSSSIIDRFNKYHIKQDDGCWQWTGSIHHAGYGQIRYKKRIVRVNRLSYELFIGPIPDGLIVRHKCDNPLCVNPDHLELGTHVDNMNDMVMRSRSLKGSKHPMHKLSEDDVLSIYHSGLSARELSDYHDVNVNTIYYIKQGKRWAWLTKHNDQLV